MSKQQMRRTQDWKRTQFKRVDWRPSDVTIEYPYGAILHWDASRGWQDQTGNTALTLIGSAYPTVSASGALNEADKEWGFDLSSGAVRTAFLAGEATIVMQVTMPVMSSLTDATDYSLWGDVLFVRRDGTSGSFKLSDGTNTATVAYDWADGEVVTVVCQCDGDVMRVGVGDTAAPIGSVLQWPLEMADGFVSKTGVGPAPAFTNTPTITDGGVVPGNGPAWVGAEYAQQLLYTEELTNSLWAKPNCTVVADDDKPSSANFAFLLTHTSASTGYLQRSSGMQITSGLAYVASCYAKHGSGFLQITFSSGTFGSGQYANFDLDNGALGTVAGGTAGMVDVGGGWYRCWFMASAISTNASAPTPAYLCVPLSNSARLTSAINLFVLITGVNFTQTTEVVPYVSAGSAATSGTTPVDGMYDWDSGGSRVVKFTATADQDGLSAVSIGAGLSVDPYALLFSCGAVSASTFSSFSVGDTVTAVVEIAGNQMRVGTRNGGILATQTAEASVTVAVSDMAVLNEKNKDTRVSGASTTKMMTCTVVDRVVADWSQTVTIVASDAIGTSETYVTTGDVVTIEDLVYDAMMQSDNNAAMALGRSVGYMLDPTSASDTAARARFVAEMNDVAEELGTSAVYSDCWGQVVASPFDQAKILRNIRMNHPRVLQAASTLAHTMTILGGNARTYSIAHTIDPDGDVKIPEFIAGKTGTGDNTGSVAVLWEFDGNLYITVILRSYPNGDRYIDLRKAMTHAEQSVSSDVVFGDWADMYCVMPGLSIAATCPGNIVEIQEWSGVYPTLSQIDGWTKRQLATVTYGDDETLTAPLPLSAQITKGHALPLGVGKITVFDGVASAGQIEEAQ